MLPFNICNNNKSWKLIIRHDSGPETCGKSQRNKNYRNVSAEHSSSSAGRKLPGFTYMYYILLVLLISFRIIHSWKQFHPANTPCTYNMPTLLTYVTINLGIVISAQISSKNRTDKRNNVGDLQRPSRNVSTTKLSLYSVLFLLAI